jgi:hypothetical protein
MIFANVPTSELFVYHARMSYVAAVVWIPKFVEAQGAA